MYDTINALNAGKVINLGGILLKRAPGAIAQGDLYVAERNTGPKLLTAQEVDEGLSCIHPTTFDYSFNFAECVRVCAE